MPPVSPSNGDHLPKLNLPNLRTLDSGIKTDKSHLLRTFIRSQEAHLSSYALEGKSVAASWDLNSGDVVDQAPARTKRRRDVDLESGFGTPLLKPRVQIREPRSVVEVREKTDASEEDGDSPVKSKQPVKATRTKTPSRKTAKENVRAIRERDEASDEDEGRAPKRLRQSNIQEFTHPQSPSLAKVAVFKRDKQKNAQDKQVKQKDQNGEVDEEHRQRLAERRERRRAKKAIVDPKPAPSVSESGEENNLPKRKGAKKAIKKGQGLNIPAGLALMHGFSAKNIGQNRLTLNHDPVVGVFNKGKASARTSVKRSKASKPYLQLFSEERFLSKAPGKDLQHTRGPSHELSDSDDSGTEEECLSPKKRLKKVVALVPPTAKRNRSKAPTSVSTVQDEHTSDASDSAAQSPVKRREPVRDMSPVWDIEADGGQLPSGSDSGQSARSDEEGTKPGGTVLLATGAFTSRWTVLGTHRPPTDANVIIPIVEHSDQKSAPSSIAPSHSASQVVSPQDETGAASGMQIEAFSRYFLVPPNARNRPNPEPQQLRHKSPSLVSEILLSPRKAADPRPRTDSSTSAIDSLAYGYSTAPLRSGLGNHLPAPEQRPNIDLVPDRASSSAAVEANLPVSPVLCPTTRSSSLCLPFGPGSPASPGRVTQALGYGTMHLVPRNSAYEPAYVSRRTTDGDGCSVDWSMHAAAVWEADGVPTFLSDCLAGNETYVQDAVEEGVEELGHFVESYTVDEQGAGLSVSSPMLPAFDLEAIAYHHDPASWEYTQDTGAFEQEHRDSLPRYDNSRELAEYEPETPYLVEDVGVADEEELRWLCDGAEDGGMEFSRNFIAGDPEDGLVLSETEFALPRVALADGMESDDAPPSEAEGDPSVLGALPRFSQGRALLLGVADTEAVGGFGGHTRVSRIEEDVARSLKGHWLPQRF